MRLAIDFAIWQYQNQAAQGGTNPAVRNLFYRLARLKATPVEAIFVFDGPHKPKVKRNKRSGRGCSVAVAQAKRLMRLFGFPFHDAPGEAEAECALLQKHGVVDAVLSEDVDTVMFGCTKALRKWSSESASLKTPTHVSVYDASSMTTHLLDREGMILVAMMSGGDYLPDGIPGCGVKVACEAARAGFGKSMCRLKTTNEAQIREWRERLSHELVSNESKFFRTKHKALKIPDDFPDPKILRLYTNPVVSPKSMVDTVRAKLEKSEAVQLEDLREFTREEFGWDYRIGAFKFIRVLGTALLATKLQSGEAREEELVKRISGRREHFSADAEPELRVAFVPSEVVPIDISNEVDEIIPHARDGLAVNSEEELDEPADTETAANGSQPKLYDITKPELAWVSEEFATKSIPSAVAAWKEAQAAKAAPKSPKKKRTAGTKSLKNTGMPQGALNAHFKVVKPASSGSVLKPVPEAVQADKVKETSPEKSRRDPLQHSSTSATGMRQPSKPPHPPKDPNGDFECDKAVVSSPMTPPRTRNLSTSGPETILISSSPLCAPSPHVSSSYESGTCPPSSAEVFDDVRPSDTQVAVSKSIKERPKNVKKATKKPTKPAAGSPSKLRQTTITMFAAPAKTPTTSQVDPPESRRDGRDEPQPTSSVNLDESYVDDSSVDLPPLSALLLSPPPSSPKSPTKRLKSPAGSERDSSPTRASKIKKKLLVSSTNGFMTELTVDAKDRDDLEATETRRLAAKGIQQRPIRMSDVSFVDLT